MERQDKMMSEIKEMETKHNGCEERLSTVEAQVLGRKTQNQTYHNDLKEIKDRLASIEATALEKETQAYQERIHYDLDQFKKIMTQGLNLSWTNEVRRITRLDVREDNGMRSMRVELKEVEDNGRIMFRLNEMRRNKDARINMLFIVPDRTREKREKVKKLRGKLKTRKEQGENNLTITRGKICMKQSFWNTD
ncbi:hypothetical protein Pmani_036384 [Petrolisthes manimaculis]|uniref:Uncharacterized protein n=1 Tax=Petrolisthes manimaculis TaxID=1843537 RepID=A0AAE1NK94_9EUCA|nr:hypothetical protein Pmani_036384 [Petrolisthes manimaculis]